MITYDEIQKLTTDCLVALKESDNRSLKELREDYKEALSQSGQILDSSQEILNKLTLIDNLIWVKEFCERYLNKTKTEIEFDATQSYFDQYVKHVQEALNNIKNVFDINKEKK